MPRPTAITPLLIGTETYSRDHLTSFPYTFDLTDPATGNQVTYRVRIVFSDHCYTTGQRKNVPLTPEQASLFVSEDKREYRLFSLSRYELSKNLPDWIRKLPSLSCFHGDRENYFTTLLPDGQRVYIFFQVSLRRSGLVLQVESAHTRAAQLHMHRVPLGEILSGTQQGHPPRPVFRRPGKHKK